MRQITLDPDDQKVSAELFSDLQLDPTLRRHYYFLRHRAYVHVATSYLSAYNSA